MALRIPVTQLCRGGAPQSGADGRNGFVHSRGKDGGYSATATARIRRSSLSGEVQGKGLIAALELVRRAEPRETLHPVTGWAPTVPAPATKRVWCYATLATPLPFVRL